MTGHPDGPLKGAWRSAYETASTAASPLPELQMDLHEAVGRVISRDITALTDLPSFDGARGVLRYERGQRAGCLVDGEVEVGADIRRRGLECHAGDVLAKEGDPFTPALAGLTAAAGHDRVWSSAPARRPPPWGRRRCEERSYSSSGSGREHARKENLYSHGTRRHPVGHPPGY